MPRASITFMPRADRVRVTKRRFDPNIQKKTYFVPSLGRKVTLTLSARGIKVIDARGIDSVISELVARGEKI